MNIECVACPIRTKLGTALPMTTKNTKCEDDKMNTVQDMRSKYRQIENSGIII